MYPTDISSSALLKAWQGLLNSENASQSENYRNVYGQSLSLRERIAAFSGLTRTSDATAFYLAEASSQSIPDLLEYLKRIESISMQIITNGFDAESYTLVVSLDKRIDELQMQLDKTTLQLNRVAEGGLSLYLSKYSSFT